MRLRQLQPRSWLQGRSRQILEGLLAKQPDHRRRGDRIMTFFAAAQNVRLLAQSGHHNCAAECPLSGVKRTSTGGNPMSAFDPKRTLRSYHLTTSSLLV